MQYRRAFIRGGRYFFTVVTERRRPIFTTLETVEVLRSAFRRVREKHPFTLDAMVALPDHLHCIWTLPPDDADFATRWRLSKTWFTKHCDPDLRPDVSSTRRKKGQQALWQNRYWEHALRDENDFNRHVDYIHYNPVRHGYVDVAVDWPNSSFRRFVEQGFYARDWGGGEIDFTDIGHE